MRIIINIILILLVAVLAYLLVNSINTPIRFRAEKDIRETAVENRLKDIREVQEMHRAIYNEYAKDFGALKSNIESGQLAFVKVEEDETNTDPNVESFVYDTSYVSAIDSIMNMGISLDSLALVPYGEGATFNMVADTITYQKTKTNVLEVSIQREKFMGKYADPKFAKYDDSYDPKSILKFGDLNSPNLGGNWE